MIHVIATIDVVPGKRAEFLKVFHALVPTVKAEAGCIEYGPTVDTASGIPVQISMRPNIVTVVEKWKDLDALRAHAVAPHMEKFRTDCEGLVKSLTIQVLDPA